MLFKLEVRDNYNLSEILIPRQLKKEGEQIIRVEVNNNNPIIIYAKPNPIRYSSFDAVTGKSAGEFSDSEVRNKIKMIKKIFGFNN